MEITEDNYETVMGKYYDDAAALSKKYEDRISMRTEYIVQTTVDKLLKADVEKDWEHITDGISAVEEKLEAADREAAEKLAEKFAKAGGLSGVAANKIAKNGSKKGLSEKLAMLRKSATIRCKSVAGIAGKSAALFISLLLQFNGVIDTVNGVYLLAGDRESKKLGAVGIAAGAVSYAAGSQIQKKVRHA